MSAPAAKGRNASPFSRGGTLAVLLVGFGAFFSLLYFIGAGDTGDIGAGGPAHASADGLNGYSGLVTLLESEGYEVERSRSREGYLTTNLLILTPPEFLDPEELASILDDRQYYGPTLVILPKWSALRAGMLGNEEAQGVPEDWVEFFGAATVRWTQDLPEPFAFTHTSEELEEDDDASWQGMGVSGELPTKTVLFAEENPAHEVLVADAAGHALAFNVVGEEGTDYYENAHWTSFVVEPDLMNNYGMADAQRAAVAVALVREAGYADLDQITVDLTLNGLGGSTNLLTLAIRPPFLAATLCLLLAMLIIGWRAFMRFGPAAASGQEIAFGKERLVNNGAGLIVRARRLGLLAEPYTQLVERRLGRALGLARPDAEMIDAALAIRLPAEEPFSLRAARLNNATKPMEILRAARALNELTGKLAK